MTLTLTLGAETHPLPEASLLAPGFDEKVTPLAQAIGLEATEEPSFLTQARDFARIHPTMPVAWARLAQAEQSLGNTESAVEAASRALESPIDAGRLWPAASYAAATILARNGHDAANQILETLEHPMARVAWARMAVSQGDYEEAMRRLDRLETSAARALRGYCLVAAGRFEAAVTEYRAALRLGRGSLEILVNLGYALAHLGALEKAIRTTRQATAIAPTNKIAGFNLARYLAAAGQSRRAVAELDRLAAARPLDYKITLTRAWAHADLLRDPGEASRILSRAQAQWLRSDDDVARAEISGSVAFLRWQRGTLPKEDCIRSLWSSSRRSEHSSPELVRMLAAMFDRREYLPELRRLLVEAAGALGALDIKMLESREFLLSGDVDAAAEAAAEAAELDSDGNTDAAGVAAYLVAEVTGDYDRGAELASRAFELNRSAPLANNYAFCLALANRPRDASRVLSMFEEDRLPYHGATRALIEMSFGRVESGLHMYHEAAAALRAEGDSVTADYVLVRGRLALRQLGIAHPESSSEAILSVWPADGNDPRWSVMDRVATRVGVHVPRGVE